MFPQGTEPQPCDKTATEARKTGQTESSPVPGVPIRSSLVRAASEGLVADGGVRCTPAPLVRALYHSHAGDRVRGVRIERRAGRVAGGWVLAFGSQPARCGQRVGKVGLPMWPCSSMWPWHGLGLGTGFPRKGQRLVGTTMDHCSWAENWAGPGLLVDGPRVGVAAAPPPKKSAMLHVLYGVACRTRP